jgi:hypothetical protein
LSPSEQRLCEIDSFDVTRPQEVELIVLLKWLVLSWTKMGT